MLIAQVIFLIAC